MLIKYFGKGRKRRGVFIGLPVDNNKVIVGYSLCKLSADKFSKEFGKKLAVKRARTGRKLTVPRSMETEFKRFIDRCKRYYKDTEIATEFSFKSRKNMIENH